MVSNGPSEAAGLTWAQYLFPYVQNAAVFGCPAVKWMPQSIADIASPREGTSLTD